MGRYKCFGFWVKQQIILWDFCTEKPSLLDHSLHWISPRKYSNTDAYEKSRTAEGSNLQHLQIITRGLTFSLCLIFHDSCSRHPSPPPLHPSSPSFLSLHFPAMCCDCISHCVSPHSEGFHFRAEPSSHCRYWKPAPRATLRLNFGT